MAYCPKRKALRVNKAVVLVHGLLSGAYIMRKMASHMRREGFAVYLFEYGSTRYSKTTLEAFEAFINCIPEQPIYVVGHSMGGLVARNLLTNKRVPRVVGLITIGTPHNQSLSAHAFARSCVKRLFGTAGAAGLTTELPSWHGEVRLGCIAGKNESLLGLNLFMLLSGRKADNDGTVFVDEAILHNCHDRVVVKGTHTGMLFQKDVMKQCVHFIKFGTFSNRALNGSAQPS